MHKLTESLRQYRHNNSDEFVMGYDKEIIDQLFSNMKHECDQLKDQLAAVTELPTFKRPVAAEHYIDLKKQFNSLCMMLELKERQLKHYRDKDYQAARETALAGAAEINGLREANEQLTNDIDRLEQERDQLKAQNAELKNAMKSAIKNEKTASENLIKKDDRHIRGVGEMLARSAEEMVGSLNKSPATCLAEIQAKAIEDAIRMVYHEEDDHRGYYSYEGLKLHAQHLRQQSTDISTQVVGEQQGMRLEKVTAAGQIKLEDHLILHTKGGIITAMAKEVISPGSTKPGDSEEIVYNRKKNHYFITSMLISGKSWVKEVYVARAPE